MKPQTVRMADAMQDMLTYLRHHANDKEPHAMNRALEFAHALFDTHLMRERRRMNDQLTETAITEGPF